MTQVGTPGKSQRLVEPAPGQPLEEPLLKRLLALEKLVRAIEDELSDGELDDEQKLQNIGERVAQLMDG